MKITWTECSFNNTREFVNSFNLDFPFKEEKYVMLKMREDNGDIKYMSGRIVRMSNCYSIIIDGHFGCDFDNWMTIISYCFLEM